MNDLHPDQTPRWWRPTRVEAISDGVFAIAITLLVIEIKISPSEFKHLAHALVHEWPGYLAYVTSFLTIGGVWIAHHNLFSRLQSVDTQVLIINLVMLMAVAFLPFPTGVLAQALNAASEAQHTAIIFYGGSVIAVELLLGALERSAGSQRASVPAPTDSQKQRRRRRLTFSIVGYAAAMAVGLAVPDLAAFSYLVIAVALLAEALNEARVVPAS